MDRMNEEIKKLITTIEDIQVDKDVARFGYLCLGNMTELYKDLPTNILENLYRTWIWENQEGKRIATWDLGNGYCKYMCEGTVEGIMITQKKLQVKHFY
jgi:hypothetical protein